jgi:beta-lactamase class A
MPVRSMTMRVPAVCCAILLLSSTASAQLESARAQIARIAEEARGRVGVAAIDLSTGDTLTVRGDDHFPMQSVYKVPLALAVLARVDAGTLSLSRPVHVKKNDLRQNTWSPLREIYPDGEIDLPLDTLLEYTIVLSDNNACDILFRLVGGTSNVDRYVHDHGIANMSIVATENEMHQAWEVQYRNWSSPLAMARLLQRFHEGTLLSAHSREYLWRLLARSKPGSGRIKGLLPPEVRVAHKTGSSGTDEHGVAAATNDIGFLTLRDGRCMALVVFLSDSDATEEQRDGVIASIARAVWDAME